MKLDYNYAKDEKFATELMTNLLSVLAGVQSSRKRREEIWQESYRTWSIDRTDSDQTYQGMANLKVPQLRKEIETMSRRLFKGLFPEDYLKGEPASGFTDDNLTMTNTQLVRHYYDNVIQIKRALYPWVKQNVILGTSPIRQYWYKQTNEMFYKKRTPYQDKTGIIRYKGVPTKEEVILYNAPKLRTEDLFQTWIYPHNASTQEDIEIVFWQTFVKKSDLEKKAKEGMCANFDQLKDQGADNLDDYYQTGERLAQFGDNAEFQAIQEDGYYRLIEIWCNLVLPGSDRQVPCVVEIVNDQICTRIQRNPYWHQLPPFDFGRFIIPPPGEFYGRGLPEAAMSLQLQLDDTMNQTMDANTLALNNVTIVNPAYAPNADSFEVEPGAVWWADPAAVKQFTFPDLSDTGYKAAGILRGWISEMSDNQPQLPDPIAGKARSTGQAQMAVSEWQTDLFVFIEFLSSEALNSMAIKTHSLIQQNISDEDVIRVTGKYANTWIDRIVTPDDITGRYKFKWMGALQIENQSIKTQQMLNFLNVFKNLPPEAQAQVKILWPNFVIKIMRDGFLIKDIDNIIETDRMKASTAPDLEHKILDLNGDIKVVKSDNDDLHLAEHALYMRDAKDLLARAKMTKHMEQHQTQKQEKIQEVQQLALQMQMQQPQQSGGPSAAGNRTQIPQSTSQDNMERGLKIGTT